MLDLPGGIGGVVDGRGRLPRGRAVGDLPAPGVVAGGDRRPCRGLGAGLQTSGGVVAVGDRRHRRRSGKPGHRDAGAAFAAVGTVGVGGGAGHRAAGRATGLGDLGGFLQVVVASDAAGDQRGPVRGWRGVVGLAEQVGPGGLVATCGDLTVRSYGVIDAVTGAGIGAVRLRLRGRDHPALSVVTGLRHNVGPAGAHHGGLDRGRGPGSDRPAADYVGA